MTFSILKFSDTRRLGTVSHSTSEIKALKLSHQKLEYTPVQKLMKCTLSKSKKKQPSNKVELNDCIVSEWNPDSK